MPSKEAGFRFEARWVHKEGWSDVIKEAWILVGGKGG